MAHMIEGKGGKRGNEKGQMVKPEVEIPQGGSA